MFPATVYKETVLRPAFDETKREYLHFLRDINQAHVVMLVEQGLIGKDLGLRLLDAIGRIDYESYKDREYTGKYEDLYFEVEAEIIKMVGAEGGYVHLGRSRNDIGVTLQRMMYRKKLLGLMNTLQCLVETVTAFGEAHKLTITIAHTHTQQAQPTRLGHYFLGIANMLERDLRRMRAAYASTNVSPMGAAAITTSGFAVDRFRVAELLGFVRPIENSYDAISGFDYLGEIANDVSLCAINLSKLVCDLMMWSTLEFGFLKLQDAYVQTSSIMPQKRNPSGMEHVRSILSTVVGCANVVTVAMHNTPYGDYIDAEDDMNPFLLRMMSNLDNAARLLSAMIATMDVDCEMLLERAKDSFSVITELADTLVRETHLSFRQTHGIAAKLVRYCRERNMGLKEVTTDLIRQVFEEVTGSSLTISAQILKRSLSPENFADIRNVYGGISPHQMELLVNSAWDECAISEDWLREANDKMIKARETLEGTIGELLENSD